MNDARRWFDRIAHDLRGPLTPLQTAAYLLKNEHDQLDPPRRRELAGIIERQAQRLARMIEELDDWSRIRQQRLLGTRAPIDLASCIDLAISAVPNCLIEPEVAPDCVGACIDCDQLRLVQAFKTLLEHAWRRDPGARVRIARDRDALQVLIEDHGEPIDPTLQASLLEQPDPAPDDEGLGLRLLIARAIVEAHGGTLAVEPADAGLTLRCNLPETAGSCS